jgi:ABC-2 type transport system permease protein
VSFRRVGVLLSKEFLYGSKSYMLIFSIVGPVVISLVISLIFGTLFSETPKMGIVDEGNSRMVSLLQDTDSVESREYGSISEMTRDVERGTVDMGIVVPPGFDEAVIAGEAAEIKAYVWGESLAKSRTIIGVTIADLIRNIAGQEAPVDIITTTLGDEMSIPWNDRLLPLIVLISMFLGGLMLPATSLATEKEKKTLVALEVTPVSMTEVFLAKGMLGFILSLFMGIFILILNQAFGTQPALLTMVLALGAVMAAELGMLLGAFVRDFATLFAIWKTAGIILFAPVFIFLFPQIPEWIGRIFPTYYILQPVVEISQLGGGWPDISVNTFALIGWDVALLVAVTFVVSRVRQTSA